MKFNQQFVTLLYLPVSLVSQKRLQGRGSRENMGLTVVEAVPADSKPPAVDDSMRTSTGRKYDFGASAPLLTRTSPMHFYGAKRGSVVRPKLAKHVWPSSTRSKELLSPCFARSAAASSVRLRVFVSGSTSASVARCRC